MGFHEGCHLRLQAVATGTCPVAALLLPLNRRPRGSVSVSGFVPTDHSCHQPGDKPPPGSLRGVLVPCSPSLLQDRGVPDRAEVVRGFRSPGQAFLGKHSRVSFLFPGCLLRLYTLRWPLGFPLLLGFLAGSSKQLDPVTWEAPDDRVAGVPTIQAPHIPPDRCACIPALAPPTQILGPRKSTRTPEK